MGRYYIKNHGVGEWYVFDGTGTGRWIAKCHNKEDAEKICALLNAHQQ
jgi:hypothetical protein